MFDILFSLLSLTTIIQRVSSLALTYDAKRVLDTVNGYRTIHRANPLIYDSLLNKDSQKLADALFDFSPIPIKLKYGSNFARIPVNVTSNDVTDILIQAVQNWYSGYIYYSVNTPGQDPHCHNFTQLVWKASKLIGVGFSAYVEKGVTYVFVVMDFYPKGNIPNTFYNNVSPAPNPYPPKMPVQPAIIGQQLCNTRSCAINITFYNEGKYTTVHSFRIIQVLRSLLVKNTKTINFTFIKKVNTPNFTFQDIYKIGPFTNFEDIKSFTNSINLNDLSSKLSSKIIYFNFVIINY
jgi:hypothetical protein